MIADGELIVSGYLRQAPAIAAIGSRVAGKTPEKPDRPWIRLTQLDARNVTGSRAEHLIAYDFQLDCYAGVSGGQAEAWLLARTARALLSQMPDEQVEDVVVCDVGFTNMARLPDENLEPARERVVLDVTVRMHTQ